MPMPSQPLIPCKVMGKRVLPLPEDIASSNGVGVAPTQQSLARISSISQAEEHLKQTGWRVTMPHQITPSCYMIFQNGEGANVIILCRQRTSYSAFTLLYYHRCWWSQYGCLPCMLRFRMLYQRCSAAVLCAATRYAASFVHVLLSLT